MYITHHDLPFPYIASEDGDHVTIRAEEDTNLPAKQHFCTPSSQTEKQRKRAQKALTVVKENF